MGRAGLLLALASVALLSAGAEARVENKTATRSARSSPTVSLAAKKRGVCWVAGPKPVTAASFKPLVAAHVTWISQTPFGWQPRSDRPEIFYRTEGGWWGESDEGLAATTKLALSDGIHTMLSPHLWLRRHSGGHHGKWRSDIAMKSERDWQRWFANYDAFILHYAHFASRHEIGSLVIGTELAGTLPGHEAEWRHLIGLVRAVYHGRLTYAANWYDEADAVPFWDALDAIGIQAYFPLSKHSDPSLAELENAWRKRLPQLATLAQRFGKPIVFTEIGYRSTPDAAVDPWRWPDFSDASKYRTDNTLQARCYQAFFDVVWPQPWFGGAYFWKWYPAPPRHPQRLTVGFTPQGKPALEVLRQGFAQP